MNARGAVCVFRARPRAFALLDTSSFQVFGRLDRAAASPRYKRDAAPVRSSR